LLGDLRVSCPGRDRCQIPAEALGVTQLLERLDDRSALLAGGDRLAAARHRSLEAAVAWGYRLVCRAVLAGLDGDIHRWITSPR
jgi:hypothetical protein